MDEHVVACIDQLWMYFEEDMGTQGLPSKQEMFCFEEYVAAAENITQGQVREWSTGYFCEDPYN